MAFALNALPLVVAIVVYVLWIRPTIRNLPHIKTFYDGADGFWQRAMLWIRIQWDGLVAGFLIVWPQLPDMLQQITGLDMSALIPTESVKLINQGIGVALVIIRAVNLAATKRPS